MASQAFVEHKIVPDVVKTAPNESMTVEFDNGSRADFGNILTPTQVQNPPVKIHWNCQSDQLHTLIMTDPDAPSRDDPKFREWHHWLVVNIAGNDLSTGDVLSEYVGAGPPEDTGLHRYVYLVYKQRSKIVDLDHGKLTNRSGEGRACWSAEKFTLKHHLGVPIAGNLFQAKWDTYVPTLYKQLEG